MKNNLIFEIGTEELPSSCIHEGIVELKKVLSEKLTLNNIDFKEVNTYGAPRRLIANVLSLSDMQNDTSKNATGPSIKAAYDSDGNPTKAAIGFAKSLSLDVSELEKLETEKGIYLYKKIRIKGRATKEVLPDVLRDTVLSLNFNKQMTWGDYSIRFARPIRWLLALYGKQVIPFEIESLTSSNCTYGLRSISPGPIVIDDADTFFEKLKNDGKVISSVLQRRQKILSSIEKAQKELWNDKVKIIINEDILEEVVNLIESPNLLIGTFPEKFLYLPKDLLIKAIEYHQRYFATIDSNSNVTVNFAVVQNGISDLENRIIKGNERVLKARLSDAVFFYEEDKKHTYENLLEKLKGLVFYSGLGNMYDKSLRLKDISSYILKTLKDQTKKEFDKSMHQLERAALLCKTDLVTNMVVEFPELQGIVGREYALERGEDQEIANAISDHYLPGYFGDEIPGQMTGSILSIADKIDTICGMFIANNIPSGSEDPFALRRRALGIVSILIENDWSLNIGDLVDYAVKLYEKNILEDIEDIATLQKDIITFILNRYKFFAEKQDKRIDIIESIIVNDNYSLKDINRKYEAIYSYIKEDDVQKISLALLRCKNIIKKKEISEININLFKEKSEMEIFEVLLATNKKIDALMIIDDYKNSIKELGLLSDIVNDFFDNILIMDEDFSIRQNRINIVKSIVDTYLKIADFTLLNL
jgi:glycyl-tRNA synthetase beta chain